MPRKVIDIATDNGTWRGDLAPVAFTKCNDNFAEVYQNAANAQSSADTAKATADSAAATAVTKVSKGANGTWPDAIPTASALWGSPARIQRWNSNTQDRPVPFGLAICWSTLGHFNKVNDNWISQMGFGTDGEVYYTQSVNGNQFVAWRKFWSTGNTTVDANNFIKRA